MVSRYLLRATSLAVIVVLIAGCSRTDDIRATDAPNNPVGTISSSYTVRRGQIIETVHGIGRVTSVNESSLVFRSAGRIRTVHVEVGQTLRAGDLVAELDTGQLGMQIEMARINSQVAEIRLAQVVESPVDDGLRVASAAIAKARAEQARALAELENRNATLGTDAQGGNGRTADAAIQRARARMALVTAGSQPTEISAAERDVTAAKAVIARADLDLEKAKTGFTPEQIRAVEHELEAAKNGLYAAQVERDAARGRGDGSGTAAGDARISARQADIDAVMDKLRTTRAGGKQADIAVAEKNVDSARASLEAAEARLQALRKGPRAEEVTMARSEVEEAEARAQTIRNAAAGAAAGLTAARAAVDAAAAEMEVAQAIYDLKAAQVKTGGKLPEVAIAEKQVEIARLNLASLAQQVDDTRIRAPAAGILSQLMMKAGDQIQAYAPVGVLADPAMLQIAMDVLATDAPKVALGQTAKVTIEALGGSSSIEKIVAVPSSRPIALSTTRSTEAIPVRVSLNSEMKGLTLGMAADVSIITQKKESALIVPATAIRRFGGRTLVQVIGTDGRRRDVEVQLGITTDTEVEILDGLTDGQAVAAG